MVGNRESGRAPWYVLVPVGVFFGAVAIWYFSLRDTATPVSRDQVIAALPTTTQGTTTSEAPGASTTVTTLPAHALVYSYDTTGSEEVDALGGARHDYPAETFMSVYEAGCGVRVRWDGLVERWVEWEICTDGQNLTLASIRSFHKWFGQEDLGEVVCTDAYWLPPEPDTQAWSYSCTSDDSDEFHDVTLVGREQLDIGGSQVEAVHLRIDSTTVGATTGTTSTDVWRHPETGLVLRSITTDESTTGTVIGDVHYQERVELTLASLDPVN